MPLFFLSCAAVAVQLLGQGKPTPAFKDECRCVLQNLKDVLEASGSGLDCVLKTGCLLATIDDYAAFNEVYNEFFTEKAIKPARTCFAVAGLPLGARVEVDCVAMLKGARL